MVLDSAPPSSLVADREVAEEDGGWRSATSGTMCHDDDESNPQNQSTSTATATSTSHRESTNDLVDSEARNDHDQPDLPIIDLLDDINEHMQIEFKSEPMSPRDDMVEDWGSCLLVDDTNDNYNSTDVVASRNKRHSMSSPNCHRDSYERESSQERTFQHINKESKVEIHCSSTVGMQNEGLIIQTIPKLREANRRSLDQDAQFQNNHRAGTGTYCSFCQKTFSRAWSLQRHLADTHFYVPQSLACDQCGRSYKSRNSLVSHKSQYHAKKERKDNETHGDVTYRCDE